MDILTYKQYIKRCIDEDTKQSYLKAFNMFSFGFAFNWDKKKKITYKHSEERNWRMFSGDLLINVDFEKNYYVYLKKSVVKGYSLL
jgi:hypothetical protein